MSVHHRRAATAKLIVVTCLLAAAIWFLYRYCIAVPPAPAPRVTHSGLLVLPRSHT